MPRHGRCRLTALGERYRRYRLADLAAEEAMARSLQRYGQASPVTACRRDGQAELLDGFKRRAAAARIGWSTLSVRLVDVDERIGEGGDLRAQQRWRPDERTGRGLAGAGAGS